MSSSSGSELDSADMDSGSMSEDYSDIDDSGDYDDLGGGEEQDLGMSGAYGSGASDAEKRASNWLLELQKRQAQHLDVSVSDRGVELVIHVLVPCTLIPFDKEQFGACGINADQFIVVSLSYAEPATFQSSLPSCLRHTLGVRQGSKDMIDHNTRPKDLNLFGLWWPLEQRLSAHLQEKFGEEMSSARRIKEELKKALGDYEQLQGLIELMGIEEPSLPELFLAREALDASKGNAFQALQAIQSEGKLELERRGLDKLNMFSTAARQSNVLTICADFIIDACVKSTSSCLVCNKPHPEGAALLKPTICDEDFCNFSMIDFGLGVNLESEIMHASGVVDLLITQTVAAGHNPKADHFSPFPSCLSTDRHPLITGKQVSEVLIQLPSMEMMQQHVENRELRSKLKEIHPLVYKLLRWVVATNRCHLALLEKPMPEPKTAWQFLLKSTPPAQEARFQALKKKHGSFFAWHGSPYQNWFSILRNGLRAKNYRTAYGPGCYFAADLGTSVGYGNSAGSGAPWSHSTISGSNSAPLCVALCEIIAEGTKEHCKGRVHRIGCSCKKNSPYYRVEDKELMCTRLLFVWPDRASVPRSLKANGSMKELESLLKKL